jgi:hypothetical protein
MSTVTHRNARRRRLAGSVLICISTTIALLFTPVIISIRDAADEGVAISKYKELIASSAVVENPSAIANVTGKSNDWTAVPRFLYGRRSLFDVAVLAMYVPTLITLVISLTMLVAEMKLRSEDGNVAT